MKHQILGWGFVALAGVALAQNVPEQFVVSGKAAEKIQDFTTINLATAERIADVCEKAAAAQGVQISIMVLDNDGNHVYMDRMDGQGYLNIITADMKARTALLLRSPSKNLMNSAIQDPTRELQYIQLGEFANSGGLPIVVNKQMIGAVGVGGSAPKPPVWSDEICAHKALTEVIGASVPPLLADLRRARTQIRAVRRCRVSLPLRLLSRVCRRSSWWAARARAMFSTATRFRSPRRRRSRACAVTGRRRRAAPCRSTSSITPASSCTWSAWTARSSITFAPRMLKAQTSLRTRQPTSVNAAQLKNNPGGIPRSTTYFNLFTNAGGIPIVVDGQMIGAIGVGGGAGGGDENCAIEGLKATFGDHVTLPVYPAAAK